MNIKKLIPNSIKRRIIFAKKELTRILHKRKRIESEHNVIEINKKGYHTFFGYYDISPFNSNNEIIYLRTKKEGEAEIIINDFKNSKERILGKTRAWNWQQGSRLRWFPGSDDKIIFNDAIDDTYISRILNVRTGEENRLSFPLYDIDKKGEKGLSINFGLLGALRPAYGYTNFPYNPKSDLGKDEGIYLVDINNNKAKLILSYSTISESLDISSPNFDNIYLNHLSFSPSGDKFLFFWLEKKDGWHYASLLVYDLKTNDLTVLEKDRKVSHYTWRGDDKIICTSVNNDINNLDPQYIEYDLNNGSKVVLMPHDLNRDGHPSVYSQDEVLTDTYPGPDSYQTLLLADIKRNSTKIVAKVFHHVLPQSYTDEPRTDLHPRLNQTKDIICFDMNNRGKRSIGLLKM